MKPFLNLAVVLSMATVISPILPPSIVFPMCRWWPNERHINNYTTLWIPCLQFINDVTLSKPLKLLNKHRVNPMRGGRQQPLQSLSEREKYRGGRKRHRMVVLSLPKIFRCNHSFLKASSILSWISKSLSGLGVLMAFQVAMLTSTVAT